MITGEGKIPRLGLILSRQSVQRNQSRPDSIKESERNSTGTVITSHDQSTKRLTGSHTLTH